jgi:hypothetical protein
MDDIQEVAGDGVEDPGDDHEVHASPGRIVEATGVAGQPAPTYRG